MRLARFAILAVIAAFFIGLGVSRAHAQAVRWEPSDADPAEVILIFENCSPNGAPRLPAIEGVQADLTGQGTRTEFNNFTRTDYVQLTYRLRTRSNAPVTIPAFDVVTNKGTLRVPEFKTAGAARNPSLDSAASSQLAPGTRTVWAGEVFPLLYVLDVNRRNFSQLETAPDWNSAPLVAEDWSKPEPSERVVNGEAKLSIVYRTRAFAKNPGPLALNPVTQIVRLQTGSIGFGLFQAPRLERLSVESARSELTVRPLPGNAPASFNGAVGQFKLAARVVPEKAGVGEPITWTLELSGTGNWPDIPGLPQRDVSNDFQVVQPKAKRTPSEGKLFDATLAEDVVLVPTKPGTYALGPVNFTFFDPKSGTYQTVSAPRTTVTIAAPEAPKFNFGATAPAAPANASGPAGSVGPGTGGSAPAAPRPPAAVPAAPAGIPRDPLPGSGDASVPLPRRVVVGLLAVPAALLLGFWLFLAVRRARHTDPLRPRREARLRLATTLAALRTAGSPPASASPASAPLPALLLRWQHDTALLWQLAHAAPSAQALPDPAWATLWAEADRALYGAAATLPTDWVARAEAALAAKKLPGFNALRLFLPRNLLPFAALLVLAFPGTLPAAEPAADYAAGKWTAAEKAWREAIAQQPTNWVAHHNLSLALAQQDKAAEAAAHAAAAFVQRPDHPAVRWHLALATEKAGFVPAPLAPFLQPDLSRELARHHSAAQWQHVLLASALLGAAAVAGLLAHAYGVRFRLLRTLSVIGLLCGGAGAATAVAGWQAYGTAADARAVIVWRGGVLRSIPTEADTTQKTTPLAAGSVALAGQTFLGRWVQLTFDNGQTGWVRTDDLVPLWR